MDHRFGSLSLNERADLIWDKGIYIESIKYYGNSVSLCALDSEYVEVYYNPFLNEIVKIEMTNDGSLKKFVAGIKISIPCQR